MSLQQETTMASAMKAAGVNSDGARLYTMCCELQRNGRPLAHFVEAIRRDTELLSELAREYWLSVALDRQGDRRLPGEGLTPLANKAGPAVPASRQPDAADEANQSAPAGGHSGLVSSAAPNADEVLSHPAQEANVDVSSSAGEGRSQAASGRTSSAIPGHSKRGLLAIASIQPAMARSLFDTYQLPDGRALGKVHWHELPKLAGTYRRHSRVLMLIHHKAIPTDEFATVDQVVKEVDVEAAIEQAERFNDIA